MNRRSLPLASRSHLGPGGIAGSAVAGEQVPFNGRLEGS